MEICRHGEGCFRIHTDFFFADVLYRWSLKDEVMSGAIFSKPNQACLSPPTAAVYSGLD